MKGKILALWASLFMGCSKSTPVSQPVASLSPGWEKVATVLSEGNAHCTIAFDSTHARFVMGFIDEETKQIKWASAPLADPHKWSPVQGANFTKGEGWYEIGGRGICLVRSGNQWYFYFDDLKSGEIGVAIGETLATLEKRENPVLVGEGGKGSMEQYVRHPAVVVPEKSHDGQWHMIYDGRKGSPGSAYGDLRHASSKDGVLWEKDKAHNPVLRPSNKDDFEADDVGSPSIVTIDDEYWLAYHGYNKRYGDSVPHFPHWIGVAHSKNCLDWERVSTNPVLPLGELAEFDSKASFGPAWHLFKDEYIYLYFTGLNAAGERRLAYARYKVTGE